MLERLRPGQVQTKPPLFVRSCEANWAGQDWQAGAQQRYERVMQWLGPRLSNPKPPIPKAAFDELYDYLEGTQNSH